MQYYFSIPVDSKDFSYYYRIQNKSSSTTAVVSTNKTKKNSEQDLGYNLDLSPNSPYLIAGSALHTIMNQNVS
jgi:hypothetical protein